MPTTPQFAQLGILKEFGPNPLRFRPSVASDDGKALILEGYRVGPLYDEKAVHITASWEVEKGKFVTYSVISVCRMDLGPVTRTIAGEHIDTLLINGATPGQPAPNVLIEDVFAHDTNDSGVSFLVKDGHVRNLTLRRVELLNHVAPIILCGPIDNILIDQCPGQHVRIQGVPGSIGSVVVTRSPGIDIVNANDGNGVNPGVKIVFKETGTIEERLSALEAQMRILLAK